MAKLDVSYDTVTKDILVTLDGAPIPDTDYISFENYDNQNRMYLSFKTVETDGMNIRTSVNAEHYKKDKKKKDKKNIDASYNMKYYILSNSDGHIHHYTNSSPFTSVNDGHFHGVVGDEVISADDHTHDLIELDEVEDVNIEIEPYLLGKSFKHNGKNHIYFETESGVKRGTWQSS